MQRLKRAVKDIVEKMPLSLAGFIWRLAERRWEAPEQNRLRQSQLRIYDALGRPAQIMAGPFRGLNYLRQSYGSAWLPKLLGTYELELKSVIEKFCGEDFDLIVDIGAAEGYYAIGLAVRNPSARVLCYELHPPARHLLRVLAKKNGVGKRVAVRGECTPAELRDALEDVSRPLVICDCEGFEDELLDPDAVPALRQATILVELREFIRCGVSERIRLRFAPTHTIARIDTQDRSAADFPHTLELSPPDLHEAMSEWRPGPMHWFLMQPMVADAKDGCPAEKAPISQVAHI